MREYVMLAKKWTGQDVTGWYMSEKYDGMRAVWDGLGPEYTGPRPWARSGDGATGLWSRYGNVIHAPDWWTAGLPRGVILDGELLAQGPGGTWKNSVSICRSHDAGDRWEDVRYLVFDAPKSFVFASPGHVRGGPCRNFEIAGPSAHTDTLYQKVTGVRYQDVYANLYDLWSDQGDDALWSVVEQREVKTVNHVYDYLDEIINRADGPGEGVMLRSPELWVPKRCANLLKVKQVDTGTGEVVGYTPGEGKYKGMVGALCIRGCGDLSGVGFYLSGMTDAERKEPPVIGAVVRFAHTGLTHNGVPREARYKGVCHENS